LDDGGRATLAPGACVVAGGARSQLTGRSSVHSPLASHVVTTLLWIAIALFVVWLLLKLVFKIVGVAVHLLLLLALAAIVLSFIL
jgi:hypothetical protein